jgi:hypothetical protein
MAIILYWFFSLSLHIFILFFFFFFFCEQRVFISRIKKTNCTLLNAYDGVRLAEKKKKAFYSLCFLLVSRVY